MLQALEYSPSAIAHSKHFMTGTAEVQKGKVLLHQCNHILIKCMGGR